MYKYCIYCAIHVLYLRIDNYYFAFRDNLYKLSIECYYLNFNFALGVYLFSYFIMYNAVNIIEITYLIL